MSTAIITKPRFKGCDNLKVLRLRQNPLMYYNKIGVISNDGSHAVYGFLAHSDIMFGWDARVEILPY